MSSRPDPRRGCAMLGVIPAANGKPARRWTRIPAAACRSPARPPGGTRGAGRPQPRPGQELVMTAPVEALDLSRRITEQAYRAGASLVTTSSPTTRRRWPATASLRCELRYRARLAVRRHGAGLPQRRGAAGDRRRGPDAAGRPGPGEGGPRQPRPVPGLSPGAGADHRLRHQLDARRRRHPGLGRSGLPATCRRTSRRPAVGRDLRRLARRPARPGRRLGTRTTPR